MKSWYTAFCVCPHWQVDHFWLCLSKSNHIVLIVHASFWFWVPNQVWRSHGSEPHGCLSGFFLMRCLWDLHLLTVVLLQGESCASTFCIFLSSDANHTVSALCQLGTGTGLLPSKNHKVEVKSSTKLSSQLIQPPVQRNGQGRLLQYAAIRFGCAEMDIFAPSASDEVSCTAPETTGVHHGSSHGT